MSQSWTIIAASGILIRATILDDASLQGSLCSASGRKSWTSTILLKFGTKLVQYVCYLMQKKPLGYCGKFRAIREIQTLVPKFQVPKNTFFSLLYPNTWSKNAKFTAIQTYIELNYRAKIVAIGQIKQISGMLQLCQNFEN